MSNPGTRPAPGEDMDAEIMAALADGGDPVEIVVEDEEELTRELDKHEMYEAQDGGADLIDGTKPAGDKPKTERKARITFAKPSEAILHKAGSELGFFALDGETEADDLETARDELLATVDGLAKKIKEKAVNVFDWIKTGKGLSNYTRLAIETLIADGEVTSKSLVTKMQTRYSLGTSRSQAQQMMSLLPVLKIANKDGAKLVLNPASTIIAAFKARS